MRVCKMARTRQKSRNNSKSLQTNQSRRSMKDSVENVGYHHTEDTSSMDQSLDYQPNHSTANEDSNDSEEFGRQQKPRAQGRGKPRAGVSGHVSTNRSINYQPLNTTPPTLDEVDSLYEIVLQGRVVLQTVVDHWIKIYRQDREIGIVQLLQFFIRSSGCKGKINTHMRQTYDNAQIIRALVDDYDGKSGEYPMIMNTSQWKKFRSNFSEFIKILISQCQYAIIYDQFFMENLTSFLISLSDSQVRAFRHTATWAAMKLMTALVDVALNLTINLDNIKRQYDAEREKSFIGASKNRSSERLEMLMDKQQELKENNDDIKRILDYLFKSVFIHRYRDNFSGIRSICLSEIGIWMKHLPDIFLDDSYLKYVGWTLNDKMADVRLRCLQSLLPLYESEEFAQKMELFTSKFKDRIVSMTLDNESDVSLMAVKLVINIHKYHQNVLTDKDFESIYELVFAANRALAQAAGEFLIKRLFQANEARSITENLRNHRGKKRSVHTPMIRDLIQFYMESEVHQHGAYLVDSLIESTPMMKDWECMTDLLIEQPGPEEEALNDRQETSLIEIMVCCIRQASTCNPPVGRGSQRKQLTAKERKILQEDKERISEHFILVLPTLLNKYKADLKKMANLLTILQYIDLNFFSKHPDQLASLLRLLSEIVDIHSDKETLEMAAKTFEYLYNENFSFSQKVSIQKSSLIDQICIKYRDCVKAYQQNPSGDEEKLMVNLQLKKISIFYSSHDLTSFNLWDEIFNRWIRASNNGDRNLPNLAVKFSIISCHMELIWELHNLIQQPASSDKVLYIKNKLFSFMDEMRSLMNNTNEELEEEAYISICDLLIVFNRRNSGSAHSCQLVYKPDGILINQLEYFIQTRVFDDTNEELMSTVNRSSIEILHKRRHFLSAFCKLVVYNVIPIKHAACVIKHYVQFYNDYGDIIKTTLDKTREINKVMCAKTMATALISVFIELRANYDASYNHNAFTKQDENFQALKELARRFAHSFGLDNVKNREAIAAVHQRGIFFVFNTFENPKNPLGPSPNLPFLDIVVEFSPKLLDSDKKAVLEYLGGYTKNIRPTVVDGWQSLIHYRTSLMYKQSSLDRRFQRRSQIPSQNQSKKRGHDHNDVGDEEMEIESYSPEI